MTRLLSLVAFSLSLSGSALAASSTTYSGGFCEASSGALTLNYNRVGNASTTTTLSADCPVALFTSNAIDGTSSWVEVIDYNSSSGKNITCKLDAPSSGSGGSPSGTSATVTTGSHGLTWSSSSAERIYFSNSWSAASTWAYLSCSIPVKGTGTSYLVAYHIAEK